MSRSLNLVYFLSTVFALLNINLNAERNCSALEPTTIIRAKSQVSDIVTFPDSTNKTTLAFVSFSEDAQIWQQDGESWVQKAELSLLDTCSCVPLAIAQAVDPHTNKSTVFLSGWSFSTPGNASFAAWQQQSDMSWQQTSSYCFSNQEGPGIWDIAAFTPPGGNFTVAGDVRIKEAHVMLLNQVDNQATSKWQPLVEFESTEPLLPILTPDGKQFLATRFLMLYYNNGTWQEIQKINGALTLAYEVIDGVPTLIVGDYNMPSHVILLEYQGSKWSLKQEFEAGESTLWALTVFRYNNQIFLIGGFGNHVIKIWKQVNNTWQLLAELCAHEESSGVFALGFLVDNQNNPIIASGHMDNKVRLWDISSVIT